MALIDMEGGDHMQASLFTTKGWTANPNQVEAGRVRGSSWAVGANTMIKTYPTSYQTVIVGIGAYYNVGNPTDGRTILWLRDNTAAVVASVSTNATGQLQIQNASGTLIATGTTILAFNTWYYIELKLTVNGASGSVEVHLNGISATPEIASTTGNFGTSNIAQIWLSFSGGASIFFDDYYLLDTTGPAPQNSFLGDVCVETLYPDGDGAHQDWSPSTAGAHYSKVNESSGTFPDGDTTFVSDVTPGHIDTYTVGSLATLTGNVYGVATNLYARKDDAAARQIAPVIREAGTDHVGSTTGGLTTSYLYYRQLYQLDPAGAAWTIASVNGAEYGVKEVT